MAKVITYKGYNYIVIHLYTDSSYGRKLVYHVLTNNPKWCGSLIPDICGYPNVMSYGEYKINYQRNPTLTNHLKPYYKVDLIEDNLYQNQYNDLALDTSCYYQFEYIEPYDD